MHSWASNSSSDYFRVPPRGCISLWTGKPYTPPIDGRIGGDPYRMETDEEYQARSEAVRLKLEEHYDSLRPYG